jgi:hypothetical protein
MKYLIVALTLLGAAATGAHARDAIPDIKGTWTGKGKAIIFGVNEHHPASSAPAAPRVLDIASTHVVEGQDGRFAWGHYSSAAAETKKPFARAISSDNKTAIGADTDGYGSPSSRPIAWRSATPTPARARANQLSRRARS